MAMNAETSTGFFLKKALDTGSRAFAKIRSNAEQIQRIGNAIEFFDHALQSHIAVTSGENRQQLTEAAGQLAAHLADNREVAE